MRSARPTGGATMVRVSRAAWTAFRASRVMHAALGTEKDTWLPLKAPAGQCLGPLGAGVTPGAVLLAAHALTMKPLMLDSCSPACRPACMQYAMRLLQVEDSMHACMRGTTCTCAAHMHRVAEACVAFWEGSLKARSHLCAHHQCELFKADTCYACCAPKQQETAPPWHLQWPGLCPRLLQAPCLLVKLPLVSSCLSQSKSACSRKPVPETSRCCR
jgi:hypothetical protein